jgi:hypothetical protein
MRSAVFVAVCAVIASFAAAQQATLLYEWVSVDYDWTGANRSAAIASGAFIPEHNAIAGESQTLHAVLDVPMTV